MPLEPSEHFALRSALEQFGGEAATVCQHLDREIQRQFGEPHDAQVIGCGMAGGVGRHVRHHQVGLTAQQAGQFLRHVGVVEIALHDRGPRDRVDRQ